jgi:hypothetical protein
MEILDEQDLALFGRVLTDAGLLNVNPDEQVFHARMIEKLYLYVCKEAERNARDAHNGKGE